MPQLGRSESVFGGRALLMNKYQIKYKTKMKRLGKYNRGNRTLQSRRWSKKNKHKKKAHNAVYMAIKKKILKRPLICQVCNGGTHIMAHHSDYKKPLKVVWVCWCCHINLHRKRR